MLTAARAERTGEGPRTDERARDQARHERDAARRDTERAETAHHLELAAKGLGLAATAVSAIAKSGVAAGVGLVSGLLSMAMGEQVSAAKKSSAEHKKNAEKLETSGDNNTDDSGGGGKNSDDYGVRPDWGNAKDTAGGDDDTKGNVA